MNAMTKIPVETKTNKILLGKLIEIQHIPSDFCSDEIHEWINVNYDKYEVFTKGKIGDIIKNDTDNSNGEYTYNNQRWLLIQEITPVS